jgi:hypothetical protein
LQRAESTFAQYQRLHLADGNGIEPLESISLGHLHVDELCVHAFYIRENQELLDGGVVAHIAVELGVGVAPLLRRLAE